MLGDSIASGNTTVDLISNGAANTNLNDELFILGGSDSSTYLQDNLHVPGDEFGTFTITGKTDLATLPNAAVYVNTQMKMTFKALDADRN